MIDLNELRDRAATFGSDYLTDEEWVEVIDRLEAAESDALEQARLNGVGSEREAALMAKLKAAEEERDALRARIDEMEKQEPVARFNWSKGKLEWLRPWDYSTMNMKSLYLAPGAKGE